MNLEDTAEKEQAQAQEGRGYRWTNYAGVGVFGIGLLGSNVGLFSESPYIVGISVLFTAGGGLTLAVNDLIYQRRN